jgi:hypothetical protein
VATAAAALSVAGTIAAVMLHRGNAGTPGVDRFWIGDIIVGALYPLVGAFLVRRRPDNAVGWVLTGTALIGIYAVGGQWFVRAELVVGRPLPLSDLGGWVNAWAWMPHLLLPSLVPLLFPDGRLASPRWRVVLAIVLGGAALVTVVGMLARYRWTRPSSSPTRGRFCPPSSPSRPLASASSPASRSARPWRSCPWSSGSAGPAGPSGSSCCGCSSGACC